MNACKKAERTSDIHFSWLPHSNTLHTTLSLRIRKLDQSQHNMALLSKTSWSLPWSATLTLVLLVSTVPGIVVAAAAPAKGSDADRALRGTILEDDATFSDLFPLETVDYIGFACAVAGLILAAGGGIGGTSNSRETFGVI